MARYKGWLTPLWLRSFAVFLIYSLRQANVHNWTLSLRAEKKKTTSFPGALVLVRPGILNSASSGRNCTNAKSKARKSDWRLALVSASNIAHFLERRLSFTEATVNRPLLEQASNQRNFPSARITGFRWSLIEYPLHEATHNFMLAQGSSI